MYGVISKWIFIVTFPVFLVLAFFPTQAISLTFGTKYASGNTALSVLTIGFFVNAIMGMNSESLISIGATKVKLYTDAGTAAVNFALNIVLIPPFGPLGAAIATSAAFILRNVVISAYLYRETGIVPFGRGLIRTTLVGGFCFAVAYFVIQFVFTPTIPIMAIGYAAFLILYAITIVRVGGIEKEEVMIVKSIEERFEVDLEPGKRIIRGIMR
jgi:O-antigen/teichoic acid export membrane protein